MYMHICGKIFGVRINYTHAGPEILKFLMGITCRLVAHIFRVRKITYRRLPPIFGVISITVTVWAPE